MEIVNLSHNDSIPTIARKCNQNFKQLAWSSSQAMKKQGRMEEADVSDALIGVYDEIASIAGSIVTEVSLQVAAQDIPGKVGDAIAAQDIPQMVSDEVTAQMIVPPVGSYLMTQADPSAIYANTTWQQSDTMTTDGSVVIPLWERMA